MRDIEVFLSKEEMFETRIKYLEDGLRQILKETNPSRTANNHDYMQFGRIEEKASRLLKGEKL